MASGLASLRHHNGVCANGEGGDLYEQLKRNGRLKEHEVASQVRDGCLPSVLHIMPPFSDCHIQTLVLSLLVSGC